MTILVAATSPVTSATAQSASWMTAWSTVLLSLDDVGHSQHRGTRQRESSIRVT
jgi:hypothetical protein